MYKYVCNRKLPPYHLNVQAICQTQTYYVVSVTAAFPEGLCPLYVQTRIASNRDHLAFMSKGVPGSTSYQNSYVDYSTKHVFNIHLHPQQCLGLAFLLL